MELFFIAPKGCVFFGVGWAVLIGGVVVCVFPMIGNY